MKKEMTRQETVELVEKVFRVETITFLSFVAEEQMKQLATTLFDFERESGQLIGGYRQVLDAMRPYLDP